MRLFLSSENLGNYPEELANLVGTNKTVIYIGNAKDYLSAEERTAKVKEHMQQFKMLGFAFKELDLRQYFENNLPQNILDQKGLVWCAGGNTFLLRAALKLSRLDKLLIDKIRKDKLVYGGSSAGSVVVGPTLHGTEHGDDPKAVREVYNRDVTWEGLGLIDFVIIPHWKSDWFGAEAEAMKQTLESDKNKVPYKTLSDGQVIIIKSGRSKVLK